MNTLYHRDLGLPKNIKTDWGVLRLKYTKHAQKATQDDRYGYINLPESLDTSRATVIEIEVDSDGCLEKILYRVKYCIEFDLVLAVKPYTREVKTVWLNSRYDTHTTLNEAKYAKAA